ncbi:hypothetical protein B0H10DRAFT_1961296 [Mycena sp. CBHHK59/15]|nr:hypothetical protein B0H10DRAFT_1961296 [Mycena sp. CBHHK59/15]
MAKREGTRKENQAVSLLTTAQRRRMGFHSPYFGWGISARNQRYTSGPGIPPQPQCLVSGPFAASQLFSSLECQVHVAQLGKIGFEKEMMREAAAATMDAGYQGAEQNYTSNGSGYNPGADI